MRTTPPRRPVPSGGWAPPSRTSSTLVYHAPADMPFRGRNVYPGCAVVHMPPVEAASTLGRVGASREARDATFPYLGGNETARGLATRCVAPRRARGGDPRGGAPAGDHPAAGIGPGHRGHGERRVPLPIRARERHGTCRGDGAVEYQRRRPAYGDGGGVRGRRIRRLCLRLRCRPRAVAARRHAG